MYLPVIKYAEVVTGEIYNISRIEKITNSFGPTIVIDLRNEHTLYLPKKTVDFLNSTEGNHHFRMLQDCVDSGKVGFRKAADGRHEFVNL